jgi:hypothetical protein
MQRNARDLASTPCGNRRPPAPWPLAPGPWPLAPGPCAHLLEHLGLGLDANQALVIHGSHALVDLVHQALRQVLDVRPDARRAAGCRRDARLHPARRVLPGAVMGKAVAVRLLQRSWREQPLWSPSSTSIRHPRAPVSSAILQPS